MAGLLVTRTGINRFRNTSYLRAISTLCRYYQRFGAYLPSCKENEDFALWINQGAEIHTIVILKIRRPLAHVIRIDLKNVADKIVETIGAIEVIEEAWTEGIEAMVHEIRSRRDMHNPS